MSIESICNGLKSVSNIQNITQLWRRFSRQPDEVEKQTSGVLQIAWHVVLYAIQFVQELFPTRELYPLKYIYNTGENAKCQVHSNLQILTVNF